MARLFIGTKSTGGGGAVKVMRDNADDPNTTPNNDYGKFLFNSETQDIGYIYNMFTCTFDTTNYPPTGAVTFRPAGTNASTCQWCVYSLQFTQYWYFALARYTDLDITPLAEIRNNVALGVKRSGPSMFASAGPSWGGTRDITYFNGSPGYGCQLDKSVMVTASVTLNGGTGHILSDGFGSSGGSHLISLWDLPATNTPLPRPTATPMVGQKNVEINQNGVKVTRPGFSTVTATGREFIINSDRVPAKIIATGQVTLAAGTNVKVTTRIPLTATTYLDFIVSGGTGVRMTIPPDASGFGTNDTADFKYAIEADGVRLYNDGNKQITVRYMVCATDLTGNSSGGSKVLYSGEDAAGPFVQIKRPGSSDVAPRLNEIYLDTRLSYITILDEGFLSASQFTVAGNNRVATINVDSKGLLLFPKFIAHFADGSFRSPQFRQFSVSGVISGYTGRFASNTAICAVTETGVTFTIAGSGAPFSLTFDSNGQVQPVNDADYVVTGIRYYIFGIPPSL